MTIQYNAGSDSLKFVTKTVTFTGGANLGAVGAVPIFAVTGRILVAYLVPVCTADLTEASATATISLGTVPNTAIFIAVTNATDINLDGYWTATGATAFSKGIPSALQNIAISANIIGTVAAQAVNGGAIHFSLYYRPLSSGATVLPS